MQVAGAPSYVFGGPLRPCCRKTQAGRVQVTYTFPVRVGSSPFLERYLLFLVFCSLRNGRGTSTGLFVAKWFLKRAKHGQMLQIGIEIEKGGVGNARCSNSVVETVTRNVGSVWAEDTGWLFTFMRNDSLN